MKIKITFLLLFFTMTLFGQTTDSLGVGNNEFLNQSELNYMDSLFEITSNGLFEDKKILFLSHTSKVKIISKKEFFEFFIKPGRNKNKVPSLSTRDVKPDEKNASGGYDFIFIAPSGNISDKDRKKVFKQLEEQKK